MQILGCKTKFIHFSCSLYRSNYKLLFTIINTNSWINTNGIDIYNILKKFQPWGFIQSLSTACSDLRTA